MSAELRYIGRYELRERLASGGQGEVWKAFDTRLHRFVAIKQLNAHLQDDPDSIARFEHEAQFVASFRHPNIVQIHEFLRMSGSNPSTAYMVMDYIEGPTLADYIRNTSYKKRFPTASDVVSIFTAVSLALDYAHQKGMVHRDIKPANIVLDRRNPNGRPMGEPVLMDFGIAKLQGVAADSTNALGTPLYVSPEQAQGLSGDKRSDLYSLGIILYEVMTGFPPFRGESILVILRQHCQDMPPLPALLNPDISPNLSTVILKSIAKDPDARFSSASALTIALAEVLKVPVPPELWKARAGTSPAPTMGTSSAPTVTPVMTNERDAFNQLSWSSGMTPTPLISSPPPSSVIASPLAFVPPTNDKQTPVSPVPQPSRKRTKKRLLIVSIILLVLLGLGLASYYALFVPKSTGGGAPGASTVVGHVLFLSSKNIGGDLDEVQITLQGIPDGKNYYAWLEIHSDDIAPGHWSFTAQSGSLSPPSYINPQHQNLLTSQLYPPYLFLITREHGSAEIPSIAYNDRLYYALIPQTKSAVGNYGVADHLTLDIMSCPQSDSNNICLS